MLTRTWHDVPDDTPVLPFAHRYLSALFDPTGFTNNGVGATGEKVEYVPTQLIDTYTGNYCGSIEDWQNGFEFNEDIQFNRGVDGVPACCGVGAIAQQLNLQLCFGHRLTI